MKTLFPEKDNTRGAIISDCGKYRYQLWRIWDASLPKVLFIMLNPSTANGNEDDPTIRRCINFAKQWGYGGIYVGNLFAYRATAPKELLKVQNPRGPENYTHLYQMEDKCEKIIFAWGNAPIVKKILTHPYVSVNNLEICYLELSKDGTPKHPLYLKKDLIPKPIN